MQRFTDIKAWQHSHRLALAIYRLTAGFPRSEQYLLMLSKDLGLADGPIDTTLEQAAEAAKVLHGLRAMVASTR
ncbi:MAG: four helix bundle protein [Gemmatimonadales bacterium]